MDIHLKSGKIFEIGSFAITDTYFTSLVSAIIIIAFSIYLRKKLNEKPNKVQSFIEFIFESIYNYWLNVVQIKNIKIFTFAFAFFIYILISNLIGILPGISNIYIQKHEEKISLFRSPYSDINMTLGLALVSVIGINLIGLFKKGTSFLKRYSGPIGFLELISELTKILSYSFRLFGNIFAGKTLLVIISTLIPLIIPTPFLGLEIFVGFIQALIFFVLTGFFLKVALTDH